MSLAGRVAFITGASRGVGRCLAHALARAGCDVIVAAKSTEGSAQLPGSIHDTAREVEALGARALPVALDVRDDAAIERTVAAALAHFGHIDILINNAGALWARPVLDTPMRRFDLVMGVNVRAAYACSHFIVPAMLRQGWGHVLNMSPPLGPEGIAGKTAYAISKLGMTMVALGLAEELRGRGVAANALWPATMLETAATINWGMGGPAFWRKPDIVADAALGIFGKDPATFSGHSLIDEDFLRAEGQTDFARYRCSPADEPPRVGFDFKVVPAG